MEEMRNLLMARSTRPFVRGSENRYPGSRYVIFTFPVHVFEVSVMSSEEQGDAISIAIKRLLAYYKNHPNARRKNEKKNEMSDVAMVADDLGLKEKLVEYIIEREQLKEKQCLPEHDSADGKDRLADKDSVVFYAVVDCMSGQLLDRIVKKSDFDAMKVDPSEIDSLNDNEYRYRSSVGSPEYERLFRLGGNTDHAIVPPSVGRIIKLLNKRSRVYNITNKKELSESDVKIVYEGRYDLGAACYYPVSDANRYAVTNPFCSGVSFEMRAIVDLWIKNKLGAGLALNKLMENNKPKDIDSDKKYDQTLETVRNSVFSVYPSASQAEKMLLTRFIDLFVAYSRVAYFNRNQEKGKNTDRDNIGDIFAMQDYVIAIDTFFEELLFGCVCDNYKYEYRDKYGECASRISDEDDDTTVIDLAESVGFIAGGIVDRNGTPRLRVSSEKINTFFERMDKKEFVSTPKLHNLIVCDLVEAVFDDEHPLRRIADGVPNFLSQVIYAHEQRNKAKHGNLNEGFVAYDDLYFTAVDVLRSYLGAPANGKRLPQPKDIMDGKNMDEIQTTFNAAYDKAMGELIAANITPEQNSDVYTQLLCECTAYHRAGDGEYATKLSNFYDVLLFGLIRELTGGETVDKFDELNTNKKIVEKVREILNRIKTPFDPQYLVVENYSNVAKELRIEKNIKMLSTRNKLLYYILCLEKFSEYTDRMDGEFSDKLAKLIKNTFESTRERGHNNRAEAAANKEYVELHNAACELYRYFIDKINLYKEKH